MDVLARVAIGLLDALAEQGLPHALAGGLAANAWVRQEDIFPTFDVDAAALSSASMPLDRERLARRLSSATGFSCDQPSTLRFPKVEIARFVLLPDAIVADVVLADPAFSRCALARTGVTTIAGREVPVLAPEDAILFKGVARREKDSGPIAAIARSQKLDREYIERWARRLGIWRFISRALERG